MREGVTLDFQREKVEGFAKLHDLDLVAVVVDGGVSARTLDRPGLASVLAMLDDGRADGLLVAKLDRLTRSLADWSALIDRYFGRSDGPSPMSVAESIDTRSAAGRMVLNLMMTIAQWERETIVERTTDALQHKRRKNERTGGVPWGKRLDEDGVRLHVVPEEVAIIAEMRKRYVEDGWTYQEIADDLTARGVRTKTGVPKWAANTVRRILIQAENASHDRD